MRREYLLVFCRNDTDAPNRGCFLRVLVHLGALSVSQMMFFFTSENLLKTAAAFFSLIVARSIRSLFLPRGHLRPA